MRPKRVVARVNGSAQSDWAVFSASAMPCPPMTLPYSLQPLGYRGMGGASRVQGFWFKVGVGRESDVVGLRGDVRRGARRKRANILESCPLALFLDATRAT